jgi:hypothetical protein
MFNPQPKPRPTVLTRADKKLAREQRLRDCYKAVDARDQRKCFFPKCRRYADEHHHVQPRSLGRLDETFNVISACCIHHAYFKAGLIRVEGNPDVAPVTVHLTELGAREGLRLP